MKHSFIPCVYANRVKRIEYNGPHHCNTRPQWTSLSESLLNYASGSSNAVGLSALCQTRDGFLEVKSPYQYSSSKRKTDVPSNLTRITVKVILFLLIFIIWKLDAQDHRDVSLMVPMFTFPHVTSSHFVNPVRTTPD